MRRLRSIGNEIVHLHAFTCSIKAFSRNGNAETLFLSSCGHHGWRHVAKALYEVDRPIFYICNIQEIHIVHVYECVSADTFFKATL